MRLFKIILLFAVCAVLFSGGTFLSAFFANFIVNVQNVDVALGSLESSSTDFAITFDESFPHGNGVAPYHIYQTIVCNEYDENNECVDAVPNLCPYISVEPNNEEETEIGFPADTYRAIGQGQLYTYDDEVDNWKLSVHSPCFDGECPANYDPYISGPSLPQSQKGETFRCIIEVISDDVPDIIGHYLGRGIAYADSDINTIEVSAVLTGELAGCTTDCFSNVLFLPGMMGSKLYRQDGAGDKKLWISLFDSDQAELSLDPQGKSINNIYTKNDTQNLDSDDSETGIIDEIFGLNIYNSFIDDLKAWKDEEIIADYAFVPYDWRLSLEDIITNGVVINGNLSYTTSQNFSESFILKKLEALQATSKSGKVTIIAHSNGGLVAKALIEKLKDTTNPLYDKIDKIILVAVPQIGTPDAFVALLHGTELGYGFIMDQDRSRALSENMSTVYNLLPSAGYFSTVDPGFAVDKLASFENTSFFNPQTSQYGVFISNPVELKNYILGTDGRTKPSFSDTVHPNIGNADLYNEAEEVHEMLDSWQPHPDTKVIQVAGWGEETLAGLDYKSYREATETLSYTPRMVVDGDGTVVAPSALWMSESNPNVERWWVNLLKDGFVTNRIHRNILEISSLRNFIKSKITGSLLSDPDNIVVDNTSTLISSDTRLHFTLHSPLTLGITDAEGRYTGLDPDTNEVREEIPKVNYIQIGDVQFISAPAGVPYTLRMKGYQSGHFALDIEKQEGNTITSSTSFEGIPSSTTTVAGVDISPTLEPGNSNLKIDQNGDGTIDTTLQATPNGVTIYDVTPPELQVTFDTNTKDVIFSARDLLDPHPTILTTSTSITLKDNAGNTTVIPFNKLRDIPTRLRLTYNKIIRNGITTMMPNTNMVYDWKVKQGVLTDLDTKAVVRGLEKYVFNYKKSNNATIIKEKTNTGIVTTTRPGFVVVTVKTEGDTIKVSY